MRERWIHFRDSFLVSSFSVGIGSAFGQCQMDRSRTCNRNREERRERRKKERGGRRRKKGNTEITRGKRKERDKGDEKGEIKRR